MVWAQNNAFHCLTFCEEWKNKRMNVICTIDVYKRAYPRLSIPLHVLCGLQSSTRHKGAACVLFLVLMLTLKGNTAVYKWKICGSALFSGLPDRSVPLGYVILFIDLRQGTVDTGSPLSKATASTCVLNVI